MSTEFHFSPFGDDNLNEKIKQWFQWDQNKKTMEEMRRDVELRDEKHLKKLLMQRITFGTAGLRGNMGAGFNSMNTLVIVQTTQGLVEYLLTIDPDILLKGVIVGYDGRFNSKDFAQAASSVLLFYRIPVFLYGDVVPTPFVAYGVRVLGATAGIMITASHNPKNDNGYKVYLSNGAQLLSPHDKNIQAAIERNLEPKFVGWTVQIGDTINKLNFVESSYYQEAGKRLLYPEILQDTDLKVVHTSLHGVADRYITSLLRKHGFKNLFSVEEQRYPDGSFPTVLFPNPEEGKEILDLAFKTADCIGAQLVVANDPDADRCAVAEKQSDGSWRVFTGNELGALLGYWIWFFHKNTDKKTPDEDCYMMSSTVSSKILESMAAKEGFKFIETLTGFKWMGNEAFKLINKGKNVLLAFEEAIGYMCGVQVLDKDGIITAFDVIQMAIYNRKEGYSLSERLEMIYEKYGYHKSLNSYYICYDQNIIQSIFDRLCNYDGKNTYPSVLGFYQITRVRDLNKGYDSSTPDKKPLLPTSSSSYMITFYFQNGITCTIRTSGTEPKIKYYSELVSSNGTNDKKKLDMELTKLIHLMIEEFLQPVKNNLVERIA